MGPESVKAIGYAIREAGRLDLQMGLITSSSWNAGGPWVTPEQASKALYASEMSISGPSRFSRTLPYPEVPEPKFTGHPLAPTSREERELYSKEVAVLAFPAAPDRIIRNLSDLVDLTHLVDEQGYLTWDVPEGEWTILRCVCTNNGERLAIPSPQSDGYMIDHFDPAATEMHFKYIIEKLQDELGDLRETALKYLYLPSYEIRGTRDWTPRFVEEFIARRGYDPKPFLPTLFGWTVADHEIAVRFEHDRTMTVSDLIIEYHYQKAAEVCHEYGLELHAESGGPGPPLHDCPMEALKALGVLDIPRGEFWNRPEEKNNPARVVKEVSCAANIYGIKIAEMEAFTSWRHWTEGPFELKPLADRAMCAGTNRFVFHTSPHNPSEAGKPGWAYHAGTHMNMNRIWWPLAKPWFSYISRSSYLLQQGLFVGDVCYYYGDEAPNFVPTKHVDPALGFGYDYDVANTEVILNRFSTRNGRITLPDGLSYQLLVLPERKDMNLEVLRKLERLIREGATVAGPKPTQANGLFSDDLQEHKKRDEEVRHLADKIWGDVDGQQVKEGRYGKGTVIWGRDLRDILLERGIGPDFTFTSQLEDTELDFIHRRVADEDIYFVWNRSNRWEEVDCTFRVTGKQPEIWEPDVVKNYRYLLYSEGQNGTTVHLRLAPLGSQFVIFRDTGFPDHVEQIEKDGQRIFPVRSGEVAGHEAISVVQENDGNLVARVWDSGSYHVFLSNGTSRNLSYERIPSPYPVTGPWQVYFQENRGAPKSAEFPRLMSWTEHPVEGIRYFAGIARYEKQFELSHRYVGADIPLELDLGDVRFMADVYLNGTHMGTVWKQPFRIDITGAATHGTNFLVVEVANVWSNRLRADAQLPEEQRYTHTNITEQRRGNPDWIESGLLGPVTVRSGKMLVI